MKRDIIVGVLLVLLPTISACALSDLQDRLNAVSASLSRGTPQVPNAESILSEETKKMKDRMQQCTDAAVVTIESAENTTALKSTYASEKAKCTKVEVDILVVIEDKFTYFPLELQKSGASGSQIKQSDGKMAASHQYFNENRSAIDQKFSQNVQAAVDSAVTQLTAVYNKRLPKLAASEAAEARRIADETRAKELLRMKAVEAKNVKAADERRTVVYKLISKERFAKLDALMNKGASIASNNASTKMGFKEWTIGADQPTSKTSCVSGFQGVVPELFKKEVSAAQAAARDAFQPLLDSFQVCAVKSTAFEAPVYVFLAYLKGKLVGGRYHLDLTKKTVLIDTMNGKYGKPATSERKVRTRDDIKNEMRSEMKDACDKMAKALFSMNTNKCHESIDRSSSPDQPDITLLMAGLPTNGSSDESYVWKSGATETKVKYSDFGRETPTDAWKPYLTVQFESSNDVSDQLTAETKKLTRDIVNAYNTDRQAVVNRKQSKDF